MILLRSHIAGFGKLRDTALDFQNKLNVVFAANEGGKSTLQRFLVGLLYGQLRSDLKVQRRLDPWVDQYKPWHGPEYGGILWCRLADGRELEIHRFFGKEETRIEIRSAAGEDITRQYEQQRNGEVLFARFHFGMPKELFESVGLIRENKVAEIHGYESVRDRIANLAQSGDEELSIRQSLAGIQEALDSIGSDRAPTKPYRQALDLVQDLREEQRVLDERRVQFQNWVEERNRIALELTGLEHELSIARAVLLAARRREMSAKVETLEEIENNIGILRNEIESLGARADFPSERLEALNQMVGARESLARQRTEIQGEKEEALSSLARAESERQELAEYASLAESPDSEKITEWFVSYLSQSLQKDGTQKTLARLQAETDALQKRLGEAGAAFRDPATDWQRVAREAAEDEQTASRNCAALAEKMALEKSSLSAAKRAMLGRRILAAAILFLAAVPSVARIMAGFNLSAAFEIALAAVFVVIAVILFRSASRSAKAGRNAGQMLQSLEAEQARIRDEGGKKRGEFDEMVADSGFQNVDDFLAAAKRTEQDRQKLADLRDRCAEAEQQRDRLQTQSGEIYQHLKESLARVGLSCSPGNLKFQIDALRTNLRRFRELDANYGGWVQRAAALKSRDGELAEEYDRVCAQMKSLLDDAQVESPDKFREECQKRQRLVELLEKEASRSREFRRLAGDLTLPQWRDRLRELLNQEDPQDEGKVLDVRSPAQGPDANAPYLPYLPTAGEAEEEEKRISTRLFGAREEYARALERTNQAFRDFRTASQIDEDLAVAERNCREMEKNRLALSTALETIENLSKQQQEVLAPQLNAAVEQRFLRLCGGRYNEVKIDPDFQVWVREQDSGELRSAEHLSRGTQDQLYFALRFGILDLVSNQDEPCPSLLDEPFAAYDRIRLGEAFKVLEEESGRRQLILFTCREDLLDLAGKHGAHMIRLPG